jgi:transposase-like protein
MFLQIHHLIDEHKCYEEVRKIRWPQGVHCPFCEAKWISKRGFHTHQAYRQRYRCQACGKLRGKRGRGTLEGEKPPVLGMLQRNGEVVIQMLSKRILRIMVAIFLSTYHLLYSLTWRAPSQRFG